jgi:hypothetical protein
MSNQPSTTAHSEKKKKEASSHVSDIATVVAQHADSIVYRT